MGRRRIAEGNPFAKGGDDGPPPGPPPDDDEDDKGEDGPPKHDGPPEHHQDGPPPEHHGGDPIEALPEFQAFCDANEIPYAQLNPADQEEVKAVFVDVIQSLQGEGGAPDPGGPPPSPPPGQGGPPPGPPQGPPPPHEVAARRMANRYLDWASYHGLPVNRRTAARYARWERSSASRRPLARQRASR
jgi:hypothetical protein